MLKLFSSYVNWEGFRSKKVAKSVWKNAFYSEQQSEGEQKECFERLLWLGYYNHKWEVGNSVIARTCGLRKHHTYDGLIMRWDLSLRYVREEASGKWVFLGDTLKMRQSLESVDKHTFDKPYLKNFGERKYMF